MPNMVEAVRQFPFSRFLFAGMELPVALPRQEQVQSSVSDAPRIATASGEDRRHALSRL